MSQSRTPVSIRDLSSQQSQELLAAVAAPIAPVKRSDTYTARLFGAAIVMISMVIAYGVLIFGLIAFIYWYGLSFGASSRSRFSFILLLFRWAPLFVAVCVLVALIKPIFAKREAEFEPFELSREHEPFLFEFIARLCRTVGAPSPVSIVVDADANASASYIRGLFDHRLRLTIGLPLVLGLSTRQLAGVMAHEFGHFCQTTGMKMTYMIRWVNNWFMSAAFERDAWDNQLVHWSQQLDLRVGWILWLARGTVYSARLLLIGLVMVGHFFCARLLREMEYDADRVETRLSGVHNFARTCRQLQLLGLCQAAAMDELDRYRRESRLPDNLPALIVSNVARVKPDEFEKLEKALLELKTEWSDSHPSDRDRIENAARERTDGTFRVELPGSVLFTDINGLSRVVTLRIYQHAFGSDFNPKTIGDTEQIVAAKYVEVSEGEAGLRFVLDQFCGYHTFHLPRFVLGEAMNTKQYRLNTEIRRQRLLDSLADYRLIRKQEDELMDSLVGVVSARRLIEAGFDMSQATGVFAATNLHETHRRAQELAHQEKKIKENLQGFRQVLGYRLIEALEFLRAEKIVAQVGAKKDVAHEVASILRTLETIVSQKQVFEQTLFDNRVIFLLLAASETRMDAKLEKSISAASQRIHHLFSTVRSVATQSDYPFEHGKGRLSLAEFLLPEIPNVDDITGICQAVLDMEQNVEQCLRRCVARLGSLAEKVEGVFGFEPLRIPEEVVTADANDY